MNLITTGSGSARTDRMVALAAAVVAFVVYALTMACSVSFWDSGEYIACSWIAGIPHPPCVPLFVLLGRAASVLLFFLPTAALRVNFMCVIAGTVSVGVLARLVQRWCIRMDKPASFYRPVSFAAALLSAFSFTIWQNNNAAETYAVSQVLAVVTLWVFDVWIERNLEGRPADRLIWLVLYLLTLAIAVHLAALIVVPGIALYYLLRAAKGRTRLWTSPRFLFTALGLMLIAFSSHLYMPLRAVQRPEINETDPSRWPAFRDALARKQYGQMSMFHRKGPIDQQVQMYARYLSWQTGKPESWQDALGDAGPGLQFALRLFISGAAVWGMWHVGRRRRDVLLLVGAIFLMASVFFILYLNFKTGPVATATGEVRDRDYFYADSFSLFAVFAVIGAVAFIEWLTRNRKAMWALAVLPAVAMAVNYRECDRSRDMVAHDYGINLLESCPRGAVLITNGDNDTFPLWFAQSVLGVRRDVIVSNLSLMNTNWYIHQLLDRDSTLIAFDRSMVDSLRPVFLWGPNFFHVTEEGMPLLAPMDDAILRAAFDQTWPWAITGAGIPIAVPGEGRGLQGSLGLQDLVLFSMIRQQPVHGRQIYLAGTVATENREYVDPYLVMEGIAFRLGREPVVDAVDSDAGEALLAGYRFTGMDDPSIYRDDQAVQLMRNYVSACHRLAYHHLIRGDADAAFAALEQARRIFTAEPDAWLQILASQTLIEARLLDGTQGSAAAADTILSRAQQLADASVRLRDTRLAGTAAALQTLSEDFLRENEFRVFAESADAGGAGSRWLEIEVDLTFGNNIGAWRDLQAWRDSAPSDPFLQLAEVEMQAFVDSARIDGRYDLSTGAMAPVLLAMDSGEPVLAGPLLENAVTRLSEGRTLAALIPFRVLGPELEDPLQASLVEDYMEACLSDPVSASSRAAWFSTERVRISPEALAWQCARLGEPALCYLALLSRDDLLPAAEVLLQDPESYVGSMPAPGSGSGAWAWVRNIATGS